jgi:hypothetical protein
MSTEYNYEINNFVEEKIKEIYKFMEDIQPNKKDREDLLMILGSSLDIKNKKQTYLLSGKSCCGKRKLSELLMLTLGQYYCQIDVSFLTELKSNKNGETLKSLMLNKRKLIVSESGEKEINLLITNNEKIEKFIPGLKIILLNDNIHNIDYKTINNIKIIQFPTIFVDNPTKQNEKKINRKLNKNFGDWKMAMFVILTEYYKKYKKEEQN